MKIANAHQEKRNTGVLCNEITAIAHTVKLRAISESDTPNILKWRNKKEVRQNFIYQEELTEATHTDWLNNVVRQGRAAQFIIVDVEEEKDVGSVYLRDIDMRHRKAEVGIFIGEDSARGKGLGTTVIKIILDYAFDELGLNKVFARYLSGNAASARIFEKNGFTLEGVFREDVFVGGNPADVVFIAAFRL